MLMASNFCIPKRLVDEFLKRLKEGEISPEKLTEMSSADRNAYFASFLGEMNATKVNALFEGKLLLKNQQQGLINWAKQLTGIKPQVQRDLLNRINNMTEVLQPQDADKFYADLAAQRLGVGVTVEEAGKISDLAKTVNETKQLVKEDMPIGSKERLDYGAALVGMQDYVKGLKLASKETPLTMKDLKESPIRTITYQTAKAIQNLSGGLKSMKASIDASFFGRQGLVTLINKPAVWTNAFVKMFGDWGKELKGIDAVAPVKADIFSRPYAMDGTYRKIGLDIGIDSEEAFPSAWPTKIPGLGRLYKASMSAFNAAALRMRGDSADILVKEAIDSGVTDLAESGLGTLINSMTGRGKVHLTPGQAKTINATVFSIKYFKSQVDVLTAHVFDPKMSPRTKKIAAQNLLRLIGVLGGILGLAKFLDPESTDLDPRSAKFGKIYVGEDHSIGIGITAGMGGIVTLASRLVPTRHNGVWGLWYKSAKGKYYNMWEKSFGQVGPLDLLGRFMIGKASPATRILLNIWEQKKWDGEKPTVQSELIEALKPISMGNVVDVFKSNKTDSLMLTLILSGLNLLGVGSQEAKEKTKSEYAK